MPRERDTSVGFWSDGPDEYRQALRRRLAELERQLDDCSADREDIIRELESVKQQLRDADDPQILW